MLAMLTMLPPPCSSISGNDVLADQERSFQVDVDDPVPLLVRHQMHRAAAGDTGAS